MFNRREGVPQPGTDNCMYIICLLMYVIAYTKLNYNLNLPSVLEACKMNDAWGGGGGYSIYLLVGRCGAAPHTLTLFKTNNADFPTLFKTEFRFFNTLFNPNIN